MITHKTGEADERGIDPGECGCSNNSQKLYSLLEGYNQLVGTQQGWSHHNKYPDLNSSLLFNLLLPTPISWTQSEARGQGSPLMKIMGTEQNGEVRESSLERQRNTIIQILWSSICTSGYFMITQFSHNFFCFHSMSKRSLPFPWYKYKFTLEIPFVFSLLVHDNLNYN